MDIEYRMATISDANGIADLIKDGIESGRWKFTNTNSYDENKLEKIKARLKDKSSSVKYFIAYDKKENKVVGNSAYVLNGGRSRHKVTIGWNILSSYEGKGIGTQLLTYALYELKKNGVLKVEAEIAEDNIASIKLAEKCGFEIEGKKRFGLISDEGKRINLICVGKILE